MYLSTREVSTIRAALHHWREYLNDNGVQSARRLWSEFEYDRPLDGGEIDDFLKNMSPGMDDFQMEAMALIERECNIPSSWLSPTYHVSDFLSCWDDWFSDYEGALDSYKECIKQGGNPRWSLEIDDPGSDDTLYNETIREWNDDKQRRYDRMEDLRHVSSDASVV